jgi:hypothetical protein
VHYEVLRTTFLEGDQDEYIVDLSWKKMGVRGMIDVDGRSIDLTLRKG